MRMGRAGLPVAHRRRIAGGLLTIFPILLLALLLEGCARPPFLRSSVARPAAPALMPTSTVTPQPEQPTPASAPAPTPTSPPATLLPTPGQPYIRSKIEIVWPHDNAPVREATRANVTAYLIAGQGNEPPRCDWDPIVHLWAAQNGSPAHVVATGQKRLLSQGGSTFPAWDFNDVDVSAARDPLNRLYFWASVDDMPIYSNIWAHGADARTFFPEPEILSSCR